MEPEAALRGRKRTSMEVKAEAWAVLLVCEAEAQATLGGGFRPGDVYERHFKEHLNRTDYFHRFGMLRKAEFFYFDGKQKSPETNYYFVKGREKLHRKVRDTWFPRGVPVWPANPPGIPSGPLFGPPIPVTASEFAAAYRKRAEADPGVIVEAYPPIKPREHIQPDPPYRVPDVSLRATYFSCPLCGGQDLQVKHCIDPKELQHLFESYCHSGFMMQCCQQPAHLFMITFGENSLHQQVIKVLVPGEW
jgi:hypothetical protein